MRDYLPEDAILDGKQATGDGITLDVKDYRHKCLALSTLGVGAGDTVKFKVKGSNQEDVDFGSAKSATNRWDYIAVVDLQSGSTIAGDTGISVADANDVMLFAVNVDGLAKLTVEVDTISDTTNNKAYAHLSQYNA